MAKFLVIQGPLDHDGKVFEDGQTVDLKPEAAEPLVAVGVIEAQGKATPAPAATE